MMRKRMQKSLSYNGQQGYLVTITSEEENNFVYDLAPETTSPTISGWEEPGVLDGCGCITWKFHLAWSK